MTITVEILPIRCAPRNKQCLAYFPGLKYPRAAVYSKTGMRWKGKQMALEPTHYIKGLPETLEGME